MEWYILKRNNERLVVNGIKGFDPLYGNGSWDLDSGPFNSYEDAIKFLQDREDE